MTDYELKLGGGRVVTWTGHDGMSAAQAYLLDQVEPAQ